MIKIKVLLIENDPNDQIAFKKLVKTENLAYDYTIVESLLDTKKIIKKEKFEIIVVDFNPCTSIAFNIFKFIDNTPIIFITDPGEEETAIRALNEGAYDYIIRDKNHNYLKLLPYTIQNALQHYVTLKRKKYYKERFDSFLNNVEEGIIIVDSNQQTKLINDSAKQLLGLDKSISSNQTLQFVLQNYTGNWKVLFESINKPSFKNIELTIKTSITKIVKAKGFPFKDPDETIEGKIIIIQDITKENELDRMKSDFVASVSHELRTPLASILGFSGTILRDKDMKEDTKSEFIGIIHEESKRLSRFIEDILCVSRIESFRVSNKLRELSIKPIIEEVFQIYRPQAERKGLQVSCNIDKNLPYIFGDEDALQQVAVNLIENAIKFTNPDGIVVINLKKDNDHLIFEIQDTGLGIPEEYQSKIFEKFYRVYRPKLEIQGAGLGLFIVKEIVEFHNGSIELISEAGKGSLFRIFFPSISNTDLAMQAKKSKIFSEVSQ